MAGCTGERVRAPARRSAVRPCLVAEGRGRTPAAGEAVVLHSIRGRLVPLAHLVVGTEGSWGEDRDVCGGHHGEAWCVPY